MIPPNSIRTGGEIDAMCTKCDLNLAHTIIAMVGPKVVKVKCNTCGSEHHFHGEQPLSKTQSLAAPRKSTKAAKSAKAGKSEVKVTSWENRFKGKDITRAKKYSPKEVFAEDDVVDHPTFGLGLVIALRDEKIDVAFKEFEKTLIHARGAPSTAVQAAPPPKKQALSISGLSTHAHSSQAPSGASASSSSSPSAPPTPPQP